MLGSLGPELRSFPSSLGEGEWCGWQKKVNKMVKFFSLEILGEWKSNVLCHDSMKPRNHLCTFGGSMQSNQQHL